MAPEQASGAPQRVGPATDLHALGLILYELLTGEHPFRARSPGEEPISVLETLTRVACTEALPPSRLVSGISADLDAICLKCLRKEPEDRYASAQELADDLRNFLDSRPVRARAVGPLGRLRLWARREPAITALLVLVFATLLGGLGTVSWQWWEAESARELAVGALGREEEARLAAESSLVREEAARRASEAALAREEAARRAAVRDRKEAEAARQEAIEDRKAAEQARQNAEKARKHEARERDRAEVMLGRSALALAGQRLAERRYAQAEAHLDDCPPAQREWEWRYLAPLCRMRLGSFPGHIDGAGYLAPIVGVAISPNGDYLASVSATGPSKRWVSDVRVWDRHTGQRLAILDGHVAVAFSPDGGRLATAGEGGTVRLWALQGVLGARRLELGKGERPAVRALAFSPKGGQLAVAYSDAVRIWAVDKPGAAPRVRWKVPLGGARLLAFAPDGRVLAVAGGRQVWFWDTVARKAVAVGRNKPLAMQHPEGLPITALAYAPDRSTVVTASTDGVVRAWDARKGSLRFTLQGHTSMVEGLAFDRPGARLASVARDGTLRVWDYTAHTEVAQYPGTRAVAFTPDGKGILTVQRERKLVLWSATPPAPPAPLTVHTDAVAAVAFDPRTGELVSAGQDRAVRWTDPRTRRETRPALKVSASVWGLAVHPERKMVAVGLARALEGKARDGELRVWGPDAKRETVLAPLSARMVSAAFSPDGKYLAGATLDGTVRLWDAQTLGLVRELSLGKVGETALAFSPDSKVLATASQDGWARLWDVPACTRRRSFPAPPALLSVVAFTPDGLHLATSGRAGVIVLWDVETGEEEEKALAGHSGAVKGLAFSPDGKRLASCSVDGTVRLWDWRRGHEVLALRAHKQVVNAVAFSRDGRLLASAGQDHTIGLFEAPPAPAGR
jgi:WD40 repeat protein